MATNIVLAFETGYVNAVKYEIETKHGVVVIIETATESWVES